MKYAIIKLGDKQYKVSEGMVLSVDRLHTQEAVEFNDVLLYAMDGEIKVGKPTVSGIVVKAKIIGEKKGAKIRVGRFKAKSRHSTTSGHRQALSVLQIESIGAKGQSLPRKPKASATRKKS